MRKKEKDKIEQLLGKKVDWTQKGVFKNLNLIPSDFIKEVRSLPTLQSRRYLRYFISKDDQRWKLPPFFRAVILNNEDQTTWRLGSILAPDSDKETFVQVLQGGQVFIEQLLEAEPDEKWMAFPQTRHHPRSGHQLFMGAPHVIRPLLNYRWRSPTGVIHLDFSTLEHIVLVENLSVTIRRWIASMVAHQASLHKVLGQVWEPLELVQQIYPEVQTLSDDAQIAIQALYLECTQLEKNERITSGYLGPDKWYMGDFANLWQSFGRLIGRYQSTIVLKKMTVDANTDWDKLVIQQLQLGIYREKMDSNHSEGLAHIWRSLAQQNQLSLEAAVYRALTHANPTVRYGALQLVRSTFKQVQYDKIQLLAAQYLELFRDVNGRDRQSDLISLAASAPNEKGQTFRRQMAVDPEHGKFVLAALAKHDPNWIVENGWALFNQTLDSDGKRLDIAVAHLSRNNPSILKQLVDQLAQKPAIRARLASTIEQTVRDVALCDALLKQL